ncbi:MAG: urate oxidase [Chloroflexi bacterium]|nr:urate oxidase [Chloroflexota bacterium]
MSDASGSTELPGSIAFIKYGKANVSFYRTYARPLTGLTPIPESAFVGRSNTLFAYDAEVQVLDQSLAPAYTVGDNSMVVATDTMKNFIHQVAVEFDGSTLEEYLLFLGRRFFETWDHVTSLRLLGRELPFPAAIVAQEGGFGPSGALFGEQRADYGSAMLEVVRDGASTTPRIVAHQGGREGLHLIKVTGSAFADFVRDQYTTLPSVKDRPLYIYLDAFWKYADAADAVSSDHSRYVAAEQVRDLLATVFHEFVSMSIQHLMHEMGQRMLARFPRLSEVWFDGQNRLWDTVVVSQENDKIKSYCDPHPPYGSLHLTLKRS